MTYRAADHAMGLELQIEELMEERTRAQVQGRSAEVTRLDGEIAQLQAELATTAEEIAKEGPGPVEGPELHNAAELRSTES